MLPGQRERENVARVVEELKQMMRGAWYEAHDRPGSTATRDAPAMRLSLPINVYDQGTSLVVKADVPGLAEKDVKVDLDDARITIAGERTVSPPDGYFARRQERSRPRISRTFELPCKVDPERVSTSVRDGVLTVTLAKRSAERS